MKYMSGIRKDLQNLIFLFPLIISLALTGSAVKDAEILSDLCHKQLHDLQK